MSRGRADERGVVLLLVLLLLALVTAVVTDFGYDSLVDLRLAETFRDRTRAFYLAKGGVEAGRMLLQEDRNRYDGVGDIWYEEIRNYPAGEGWVSLRVRDTGGRIDLNRLVTAQGNPDAFVRARLERLFERLELSEPEALVAALIDWLDPDESPEPGGAESAWYQSLASPYSAKNGRLDSLEELALIQGFTPEALNRLAPHVTLHGQAQININSATAEVLLSLAAELDPESAEAVVIRAREQAFTAVEQLQELPGSERWYFALRPHIAVQSNGFRIETEGQVNDAVRRVVAHVGRNGNRLLDWRLD